VIPRGSLDAIPGPVDVVDVFRKPGEMAVVQVSAAIENLPAGAVNVDVNSKAVFPDQTSVEDAARNNKKDVNPMLGSISPRSKPAVAGCATADRRPSKRQANR